MLEIYNEEYKDLLGKGPPAGKKHQVGDVALQVQADKHGLTWACNGSRHRSCCTLTSAALTYGSAWRLPSSTMTLPVADIGPAKLLQFCLTCVPGCTIVKPLQGVKVRLPSAMLPP